jgi:predicted nuclease of predicted toxin-antitoxin system
VASLYANENFPTQVVRILRQLGHDVLTSHEAGNANRAIPDEEVLAFATGQGRALLTINKRDFLRLHSLNPDHAGLVLCTQDADARVQAERIHQAVQSPGQLHGQAIRINRPHKGGM